MVAFVPRAEETLIEPCGACFSMLLERADRQVSDRVTFASIASLNGEGIHACLETCAS
jgi:hypothetical protein